MHSLTILSALAGASLALAQPLEAPAAQITAAPDARLVKPALALARRQGESKECSSKADEIWSDQPELAISDSLALWMMSQAEQLQTLSIDDPKYISGVCSAAFQTSVDAPAPIASAYSSFVSESVSWANKVKPTVTSLAQSCGGALSAGLELVLATDFDTCTSLYDAYMDAAMAYASTVGNTSVSPTESNTSSGPAETGAPTNDSDGADNSDDSTDGETTSTSTGAAPRETGFAVAAAAVVAVAGAMVAL
ncbi:predicted protein [Chaetomium globosum CBS 148.51]|uniref:Infection structure specific protein n=1 Tax=Chaetomium globosum (strain ATCC 6205 / CBS 148.51 / DSM 1962 / NBRC 6347 / NRRL 1970) TaxID=306901 RepID=Q2HHE9_CHAGB|nr:uncharacterized protein CHGG_00355 [Chaetomium globosum CBS 148.51]EAQ92120.1 predicted protein [Chaetomium globosum CBS 148.51]